jgi:Secretion system C-terminal sorting domain
MKGLHYIVIIVMLVLQTSAGFAQDGKPAFRIAPNPADDYTELFVESDATTPTAIRVFDLIGNQVSFIHLAANHTHPVRIETANLKPGVYFLSVYTSSGRIETLKFLKAR